MHPVPRIVPQPHVVALDPLRGRGLETTAQVSRDRGPAAAPRGGGVRPYAYGPLDLPHLGPERRIGGGAYDAERGLLYLTALGTDDSQGPYAYAPLVLALRVTGGGAMR